MEFCTLLICIVCMTTDMVCSPDGAGGGSILAQHVHGPSNAASPQGPTYVNL